MLQQWHNAFAGELIHPDNAWTLPEFGRFKLMEASQDATGLCRLCHPRTIEAIRLDVTTYLQDVENSYFGQERRILLKKSQKWIQDHPPPAWKVAA